MKKYVKPELFYERYELSQHIADCAWELKDPNDGSQTFAAVNSCLAYGDTALGLEGILFTEEKGCSETNYEDYCYQPGAASELKLFMS